MFCATRWKASYVDDVTYYDFDGDGQEEAIIVASSCMTGTAGPDIHSVYHVNSSSEVAEIPIEEIKIFQGRPINDQLVGNRNWRLYADDGFLVQDFYDGSGREHPLIVLFKFDGQRFTVAKIGRSPTYQASFDCSRAKSENEIIICGNADLAEADRKLAKTFEKLLKSVSASQRNELRQAQTLWLTERDKTCIPYKDNRGLECLEEHYAIRQNELTAKPAITAP